MFDFHRIAAAGLVAHVDYQESLGSTSDRALELATAAELPLPLLVLTEQQTEGRGRGTNRWWSAEGALTFSLVLPALPTALPPQRWPLVALVAGLAVAEALEPLCPSGQFQLKWPNDVYLSGGKVCGILSESVPGASDRLVVGIGVNVNNALASGGRESIASEDLAIISARASRKTPDPFPVDGAVTARAMIDVDGRWRDLSDVLLALLDRLDLRWRQLAAGELAMLTGAYRRRCLLTGATLVVQSGAQRTVGRCLGIADDGALIVATERGERRIVSGTIESWEDP